MEKLIKKARRLSIVERKNLLKKGISILNTKPELEDEAIMAVLSTVYTDEELESVKTLEQENELVNKIVKLTYGIKEEDLKN